MIKQIHTPELINLVKHKSAVIIDVRSPDAYNGWQLQLEKRGGHISGARNLPAKWLRYIDWIEIVRRKNMVPKDHIILYGYQQDETNNVAERFLSAGYDNIRIYLHFVDEWAANDALPMDRMERYRHLVPAGWVYRLIAGETHDYMINDKYIVVHAHYRNRDAYLGGHIPGAIDMDTLALEAPETWNRRSPSEIEAALLEHGITAETTVILYGKYMFPDNDDPFPGSAAGDIGAVRLAFIMLYAGVKDVRVLNGGFQSWIDASYDIDTTDVPKVAEKDFGITIPANPELAVDTPEAKEMIASPEAELVCVRSWKEYIGETSGYNYISKKGHIPGAVFADCGSDAYHMENYRNVDHTTREFQEIIDIWKKSGITPDKHLAFYCGTGWRGSEAWFNAWLLGWPRVSVYDGGWFEWSNDSRNPYETGVPDNKELTIEAYGKATDSI
jgi:molybdopterin synthase sulfurtransferase